MVQECKEVIEGINKEREEVLLAYKEMKTKRCLQGINIQAMARAESCNGWLLSVFRLSNFVRTSKTPDAIDACAFGNHAREQNYAYNRQLASLNA